MQPNVSFYRTVFFVETRHCNLRQRSRRGRIVVDLGLFLLQAVFSTSSASPSRQTTIQSRQRAHNCWLDRQYAPAHSTKRIICKVTIMTRKTFQSRMQLRRKPPCPAVAPWWFWDYPVSTVKYFSTLVGWGTWL